MAIDHSLTYRQFKLRNIPHLLRAKDIKKIIGSMNLISKEITYADFGCSNGFITAMVAETLNTNNVNGFDHTEENLQKARKEYPEFTFIKLDLNNFEKYKETPHFFDFITCFETIEHVGNIDAALNIVFYSLKPEGKALISVPIETGIRGIVKYLAKTLVYRYKLDELNPTPTFLEYLVALIKNDNIEKYRPKDRMGWSTHFGFDYKHIEDWLSTNHITHKSVNKGFTRFYIINK